MSMILLVNLNLSADNSACTGQAVNVIQTEQVCFSQCPRGASCLDLLDVLCVEHCSYQTEEIKKLHEHVSG